MAFMDLRHYCLGNILLTFRCVDGILDYAYDERDEGNRLSTVVSCCDSIVSSQFGRRDK